MKRFRLFQLAVVGAALSFCLPELHAQSYSRISLVGPVSVKITNQGKGHALRKNPPVRPFAYFITPDATNPQERDFLATTPFAPSWVRAGTDVDRTFGDYYVDPAVWTNNWGRLPIDPLWRDPNNRTNWISTREIRIIIRAPYKPPR
jgi:hypothetical protein